MKLGEGSKKSQDWIDRIAAMMYVKEELHRQDWYGLWPYHLPEVAATEEQLAAAEAHLGHELDAGYKDFLRCANGWKGFFQTVDLFGTGDLAGSDLMDYALEMLKFMDESFPSTFPFEEYAGFSRAELLPIAATREERDLFAIARPTSRQPGVVIWFAGEAVERYPSFEECFLAMADYNRLDIDYIKEEIEKGTYPF